MYNMDEEIEGWKDLLDKEIIDEATFVAEVKKIKKKHKFYGENFGTLFMKGGILLFILYLVLSKVFSMFFGDFGKTYEYVENLNDLPEPIQVDSLGGTVKKIGGKNVDITFIKEYDISGRVVEIENYFGYSMYDKIAPKDVGIAWGVVGAAENKDRVKWSSYKDRTLGGYTVDDGWLSPIGGVDNFSNYFSNNHLIPSDNKIKKLIKRIEVDDYVNIKGFLVNVEYKTSMGKAYLGSSISRTDTGSHACEVIYVTDVKWLKESE